MTESTMIAAAALAAFTGLIDAGRAPDVLGLCIDDCAFIARSQSLGVEALQAAMRHRAAAGYESRHVVGMPQISVASGDRIDFTAVIASFRRGAGVTPYAVADFAGSLVQIGGEWRFARIEMSAFIE